MLKQLIDDFFIGDMGYKLIRILLFIVISLIVSRMADWLAGRMITLVRIPSKSNRLLPERQSTLRGLMASGIRWFALIAALLASVGQFVSLDTLVWVVGLFSAAFGLGARPLISDVLTGIGLIFEDTFSVGEKVEILEVEGIIEAVNLRTTWVRSPNGELYTIPNGEIRIVRNFSRGRFSTVKITCRIKSADLVPALAALESLGIDAMSRLPNLLEPWQILSGTRVTGQNTELTVVAKARLGKAAEMRPRLLSVVRDHLTELSIELAD